MTVVISVLAMIVVGCSTAPAAVHDAPDLARPATIEPASAVPAADATPVRPDLAERADMLEARPHDMSTAHSDLARAVWDLSSPPDLAHAADMAQCIPQGSTCEHSQTCCAAPCIEPSRCEEVETSCNANTGASGVCCTTAQYYAADCAAGHYHAITNCGAGWMGTGDPCI